MLTYEPRYKTNNVFIFSGIPLKIKKGYWYHTTIVACPVCGRCQNFKERRYTAKPAHPGERFEYEERYDWCEL